MNAVKTKLSSAVIIEPDVFGDSRGWFYESYSQKKLADLGINEVFVQDNRSFTALSGTIRGLHCQTPPMAQAKLLTCLRGEIMDVAVDVRLGSPTYKQWVSVILSGENKKMFFIPEGFLHGFLTLSDDVEVMYKVNRFYSKENDMSIKFNDPAIGVEWGITSPILSDKDKNALSLEQAALEFKY